MPLKRILETLDGVAADVASQYTKVDDKFVLDIEGDDLTPLRNAKNHEVEGRKKEKERADALQEQLDEVRRGNIPKADVDALEGSWKTKVAEAKQEATEKVTKREQQLKKVLVNDKAASLARKISIAPELMADHIAKRLTVEEVEGEMVTRVLDKDGKPSALTIEDLGKEFSDNPSYKSVIIGTRGAGGGASGKDGKQQAGSGGGGGTDLDAFKKMDGAERTALFQSDPETFRKLAAQAR